MAVDTPTVLTQNSSATDSTTYTTASVSPAADALLLLCVSAGSTGAAAVPTSIGGTLGLTWTLVNSEPSPNGAVQASVWRAVTSGSPGSGTVSMTFAATQGNCTWHVVQFTGVDTANPVPQSESTSFATAGQSLELPNPIGSGNATVGFIAYNAGGAQTISPGTGYTLLGAKQNESSPTNSAQPEYRLDGTTTVAFNTSNASGKGLIGLEVADAEATPDPPGEGSASGSWSFTGSAVGTRTPKGSGSGSFTFTGAATGTRTPKGSASGSLSWTGSATGQRSPKGSATGSYAYTGSATGTALEVGSASGSASGSWGFTGSATGKRDPKATGAGSWGYVGAATGKREPIGSASGAFVFVGTATGTTTHSGTASGSTVWTATAHGSSNIRNIVATLTLAPRPSSASLAGRQASVSLAARTVSGLLAERATTASLAARRHTATLEDR